MSVGFALRLGLENIVGRYILCGTILPKNEPEREHRSRTNENLGVTWRDAPAQTVFLSNAPT